MKKCVSCNSVLVRKRRKRGELESVVEFSRRKSCGSKCSSGTYKPGHKKYYDIKLRPRGEKHYNWKGGITPEREKIRRSYQYQKWRKQVLRRDLYKCTNCDRTANLPHLWLEVDHIKPFSLFPELRFDIENGRTLCVECHKNTSTYAGRIRSYA